MKPIKKDRLGFVLKLIGAFCVVIAALWFQAQGVFSEFFRLLKPILPALVLVYAVFNFRADTFFLLLILCTIMYQLAIIEKKVENCGPWY